MYEKQPLRVLSVDFDYFLVYNGPKAMWFCPDSGNELRGSEMMLAWATKYAEAEGKNFDPRDNIVIDEAQANAVKKYIERQGNPLCMVADSHAEIYDFIHRAKMRFTDRADGIVIYNIDMHHDTYPCSKMDPLHCGNWLSKLLDGNLSVEAHWISNPHSDPEDMDLRCKRDMAVQDLSDIKFDLVFACRSGSWVPPHLDALFIKYFAKPLVQNKHGWECRFQSDILQSRYSTKEFKQLVTQFADMMAGKTTGFVWP